MWLSTSETMTLFASTWFTDVDINDNIDKT